MASTTETAPQNLIGGTVHVLPQTNQLRALHTIMRDRDAARDDFVRHSRRTLRLLVEAAIDLLPHEPRDVTTQVGHTYRGLALTPDICGVSIARAGDSMEAELRDLCPAAPIGKILIQRDKTTKLPRLYYSSLPRDIADRHVLLLDPMLATGGTALAAIGVLLDAGVAEENIVFVSLITVPEGIAALHGRYPRVRLVTSAVDERLNENAYMIPGIGDFGDRFYGTDAR